MSVFFRIFRMVWFLILVGSLLIWVVPIGKAPLYGLVQRPRNLPLAQMESCASALYFQSHNAGISNASAGDNCFDGYLMGGEYKGDHAAQRKGTAAQEQQLIKAAEGRPDPVVLPLLNATAIAVRTVRGSAASPLFIVWLPLVELHGFQRFMTFFWHFAVMSGITAILLSLYFVRPISVLSAATEQFGAGNLTARIAPSLLHRRDEIGRVSRGLNEMADRIETLLAGQKKFLAHAAHELGSPLTRLNIALAISSRKLGTELAPELDQIRHESNRLNDIVQELLLHARLESGIEFDKAPTTFAVSALMTEAAHNACFEADQQNKVVQVLVDVPFEISGYPHLLERAFDNVLRNAIRFAQTVQIQSWIEDDGRLGVIEVEDDGPGIPPGMEEDIFKPFITVTSHAVTSTMKGAGLGLAIARQAVQANGGRICARRNGRGGLTVRISFPLVPSKNMPIEPNIGVNTVTA